MTEIEDKRKELEKQITLEGRFKEGCFNGHAIATTELEAFNLGVELAQKEFLDKIDKINLDSPYKFLDENEKKHLKKIIKQSLGEKTE
jgi:hypothetical protein